MLEKYGKHYSRVALEQVMMLFRKFHNHYQMKNLQKYIDFSNFRHYLNVQSFQQSYNIDTCLILCSDYGVSGGVFM